MREIILDTETTGLDPTKGDRIVEIGAVELFNHLPTGDVFHRYINPERDVPAEAAAVHGLTTAFLRGHPLFATIADDFLAFIGDAPLVIHNADFDVAFINAEFSRLSLANLNPGRITDTLRLARRRFPMGPNSLDALCKRFGIDNSKRTKHGALLDSELLADVYLELLGGRQTALSLAGNTPQSRGLQPAAQSAAAARPNPLPPRLSEAELEAHNAHIAKLGNAALWNQS
jgi:DNA polymerase III subunit epsilon